MTADDQPPKRNDRNIGPQTGREANSPWQMPWAGWKQIAVRTWKQSSEDNVALISAGVSFYGFLAMVPLLAATVLIYGLIANPRTVLANVQSLTSVMPANVARLVGEQLMSVVQSSGSKKGIGLVIALAIALFGARKAAGSVITALNIAYEEEETRGFLRVNLLAIAITAAAVVLAVLAILAISVVGYLEDLVQNAPGVVLVIGKVFSYVLLLLGAAAAASALYRYGPNRDEAQWSWSTTGSLFAAVGWVLLTLGFGFYASHFGSYGATYGSLATVVVLLTWMFLSAYVFLFGAELNSEFEHQTAKDTTAGASRPLGERGAWSADHVVGSEEPSEPSGGGVNARQEQPRVQDEQPRANSSASGGRDHEPDDSPTRDYLASRASNRVGGIAGLEKVGMIASGLATAGLSLLRQRGRAGVGAVLLAGAVGLSLLNRKPPN